MTGNYCRFVERVLMNCNLLSSMMTLFTLFGYVYCGQTVEQLQELHKKIGGDLIKIRKEEPKLQPLVYSLLDQVGKFYSLSKEIVGKKKDYKRLFTVEKSARKLLRKEATNLQSLLKQTNEKFDQMDKKLKQDSENFEALTKHKDELVKEKENFVLSQKNFEQEKQNLIQERDVLAREKEDLVRERDALVREKEVLAKGNSGAAKKNNLSPIAASVA